MKIAVVDDDVDVRTAIDRLLRALGHEVVVFGAARSSPRTPPSPFHGLFADPGCLG